MPYLRAYAQPNDSDDLSTPVTWIASTEGVKADGMDLRSDAWNLARYEQYGPVLWAHDYFGEHPPIGKGRAYIEGDRLMVDVSYNTDDAFAMQIRNKANKGMVAGSVGWDTVTAEGGERSNELLEFSMVPVPMDPASLPVRQQRALRDMGRQLLDLVDVPESDEAAWIELSHRMVGVFQSAAEDAERRREFNDLERQYRKLDKVAPEFMARADLALLGRAEIMGLFLEGEPELCPELFPEPLKLTRGQMDNVLTALDALRDALTGADIVDDPEPPADPPAADNVLLELGDLLKDANTTITGVTDNDQ